MFRSKYINKHVKDDKKPNKKELMRPSFSKYPACWIIDHIFNLTTTRHPRDIWIFFVNMNCRYLFVVPVNSESSQAVSNALDDLIQYLTDLNVESPVVTNIIGDGAGSYASNEMKSKYDTLQITYYFNNSKYTYHNKILDRTVRTIRDMFNYNKKITIEDIYEAVDEYNTTYHKGIDTTPLNMLTNIDLEWEYIRWCNNKLLRVLQNQAHLHQYKSGNILFIHLETIRTPKKFEKQRRYWNRLGRFHAYDHGNVRVTLIGYLPVVITIPIYFTKYLCDDINSIPDNVKSDYGSFF
jgi:hypothetical protein